MTDHLLDSWLVSNIRLTVFPTPAAAGEPVSPFRTLTGQEPVVVTKRALHLQEKGEFEGRTLEASRLPDRVHWVVQPAPSDERCMLGPIVMLGPVPVVLEEVRGLIARLSGASDLPPVLRVALGVLAFRPMPDRLRAQSELGAFLHVPLDSPNASDFLLQVNRARDITVRDETVRVNRLAKWSVINWQAVLQPSAPDAAPFHEGFAWSLELDMNTAPESHDKLADVARAIEAWKLLTVQAQELVEHGDKA